LFLQEKHVRLRHFMIVSQLPVIIEAAQRVSLSAFSVAELKRFLDDWEVKQDQEFKIPKAPPYH